jgi:hypothetical protein
MNSERRSTKHISDADLDRLAELARRDRAEFFARRRPLAPPVSALLCVALCQGAALHFIDGRNGIKDFDVWTFYRRRGARQFPPRGWSRATSDLANSGARSTGAISRAAAST